MNDFRVQAVSTGQPPVLLLACRECGVLLWDIDAHFHHAHPKAEVGLPETYTEKEQTR